MKKCKCTWRKWQLCGISCSPAISCLLFMKKDHAHYVDSCYRRATYMRAFEPIIFSLSGENMWIKTSIDPVYPPPIRNLLKGKKN